MCQAGLYSTPRSSVVSVRVQGTNCSVRHCSGDDDDNDNLNNDEINSDDTQTKDSAHCK